MTDTDIINGIIDRESEQYTDDPLDRGGPTKFGITISTLAAHRGHPVTPDDVKSLERPEAVEIYAARYIRPFDGLPEALRINVLDMGVTSGVWRATRLLQQLVGATVDGAMGPETRRLAALGDWKDGYCYMRIAFYESLVEKDQSQMRFRKGWRNRALSFRER